MPRQNRVTPLGEIVATPERGHWMGNRGGCLHDDCGRLGKVRWRTHAWLICRLAFMGRHRTVMAPGRYTELFFLDEVTALAAGHRPCAECRRQDFLRFCAAVAPEFGGRLPRAPELDRRLHADRIDGRAQRRTTSRLGDLPDGTMVALADGADAWLLWRGVLRRWTPGGYAEHCTADPATVADVLTPSLSRLALSSGFASQVDSSAF